MKTDREALEAAEEVLGRMPNFPIFQDGKRYLLKDIIAQAEKRGYEEGYSEGYAEGQEFPDNLDVTKLPTREELKKLKEKEGEER